MYKNKWESLITFPFVLFGGERGIRTPGTSRYGSFQDYCNRPLYHLSSALIVSKAGAKVVLFLEPTKFFSKKMMFFFNFSRFRHKISQKSITFAAWFTQTTSNIR